MPWASVNLDLPPNERFVSAYTPFASKMQKMITEVREAIGSFGKVAVKFMEFFIGHALESLFNNEYFQEIEVFIKRSCFKHLFRVYQKLQTFPWKIWLY